MSWAIGVLIGAGLLPLAVKGANVAEDSALAGSDEFTRYDSLFRAHGAVTGVPWWRLKAIAMNESSLGRAASVARGLAVPSDVEGSKSSDGKSWGLMQITIPTARDFDALATPEKLNSPDYSVRLASKFLASLAKQFSAEEFIVKSYNQGAGNSRKEMRGEIAGYAEVYWERYQRNLRIIEERQGLS